jgi:hypothetical protein
VAWALAVVVAVVLVTTTSVERGRLRHPAPPQSAARSRASGTSGGHPAIPSAPGAALTASAPPPTAPGVAMGINITPDLVPASGGGGLMCGGQVNPGHLLAAQCEAAEQSPIYRRLQAGLGLKYARVFVPYDAIQTAARDPRAGGFACVNDMQDHGMGVSDEYWSPVPAYTGLYDDLIAAKAAGLTPLLALSLGGDARGQVTPDPTTAAGYAEYSCGVQGLLAQTRAWGLPVANWEAWNEPDGSRMYNRGHATGPCRPGSVLGGPAKAACLWEIFTLEDTAAGDRVAAGSFSGPSSLPYVRVYTSELELYRQRGLPRYWAAHPYGDVLNSTSCTAIGASGCITGATATFVDYLASVEGPSFEVWLTELAVIVRQPFGSTALNGKPVYQASAAEGFLNLPRVSPHVTQEYWYEVRDLPGVWDSALLGPDGALRTSYCVLALGMTPAAAASAPACNSPVAATAGPGVGGA